MSDPRIAVALAHQRGGEHAPRVVARGKGAAAEAILALARQHGVAVREDPDLAELLAACELGDEIPVELFDAIARILVRLYRWNADLVAAEGARGA